jgi:hypothetical protein
MTCLYLGFKRGKWLLANVTLQKVLTPTTLLLHQQGEEDRPQWKLKKAGNNPKESGQLSAYNKENRP